MGSFIALQLYDCLTAVADNKRERELEESVQEGKGGERVWLAELIAGQESGKVRKGKFARQCGKGFQEERKKLDISTHPV